MTSEEHAHHFSSWTKERLAEIDATTSIETQFQGALHKQQHEGEAAWAKAKTALDENLSWKTGALPSNPMAAGFKDVQDRAMDFAMENAELAFSVRRQDLQRTDPPRYCGASDTVCSRPDAGLHHADAGLFSVIGETLQKLNAADFPMATRFIARISGVILRTFQKMTLCLAFIFAR